MRGQNIAMSMSQAIILDETTNHTIERFSKAANKTAEITAVALLMTLSASLVVARASLVGGGAAAIATAPALMEGPLFDAMVHGVDKLLVPQVIPVAVVAGSIGAVLSVILDARMIDKGLHASSKGHSPS